MSKQWVIAPPAPNLEQTAASWGLSPLLAQLLVNRGLCEEGAIKSFLSPELSQLHSPRLLHDVDRAVDLIVDCIQHKKKIVLYGDYDVDGTTGVAILWHVLTLSEAVVDYYVPHRIEEGYGLNSEAVGRLVQQGAGLIVSIDCGITAKDVAEKLR
ncbi:MAG: DHH family phosphoesterase, partial [Planctomycetota bacterium]